MLSASMPLCEVGLFSSKKDWSVAPIAVIKSDKPQ